MIQHEIHSPLTVSHMIDLILVLLELSMCDLREATDCCLCTCVRDILLLLLHQAKHSKAGIQKEQRIEGRGKNKNTEGEDLEAVGTE